MNIQSNPISVNRDFKGIWIPREIWLSPLSSLEKFLWAEIHSLYDRESKGCFATNEYLCNFIGVKERRLQEMLANLKATGWLKQVSFDGRTRVLCAVVPEEDTKFEEVGAEQRCGKVHPGDAEKCTPGMQDSAPLSDSIDTTRDSIRDNTPPTSKVSKPSKPTSSGVCVVKKDLKKHGDFVELCDEHYQELKKTNPEIDEIIEAMNDWIGAKGKDPYKSHFHALKQWIRKRKEVGNVSQTPKVDRRTKDRHGKPIEDAFKDGLF